MIDYQAFPDIFDLIIEFAPLASLVALGACSRDLHARINRMLFKHMQLDFSNNPTSPDDDLHVAATPFGLTLRLEWLRYPRLKPDFPPRPPRRQRALERVRRNLWAAIRPKPSAAVHAYATRHDGFLSHAHKAVESCPVIDVKCQAYESWRCEVANLGSGWVPLVQSWWAFEQLNPAVVRLFGVPHSDPSILRTSFTFFDIRPTVVMFGDVIGRMQFERLVRPLFCRPGDVGSKSGLFLETIVSNHEKNLVVHLLHTDDPTPPAPDRHVVVSVVLNPVPLSIMQQLFLRLFNASSKREAALSDTVITVIGGVRECRAAIGLAPTASRDDFHAALDEAVLAFTRGPDWPERYYLRPPPEMGAKWRSRLRFITPAEYAAEVGAEQHALETKYDPYRGPPARYLA